MQVLKDDSIKCRNKKVGPRHPSKSKFCKFCNHYSLVDINGYCECCYIKIPNKKQLTELKTFDKILNACYLSIQEWIAEPCNPDLDFGWSIRIGIINRFVPVRFLAEYSELPNLEGDNKEYLFLENVKKECSVLPRYMHSIK